MATHANSTTAPARPLLPARGPGGRFVKATLPGADELLAEIAAEIDRQAGKPELPPEPLLSAADRARALHVRRQLEAAAEHGADLLSALGLPQLVGAGLIQVDPAAAGDALDQAIAALDALDGDADLEAEPDEEDGTAEPSLGAPENHPAGFHVDADGLFHAGRARCRLGDQTTWAAGGSCDAEAANEDGDDLDGGEMEEGDREPWLGAAEGAQHYRGGDLDLEQDGEIERPWWGPNDAGWNHDGGRYA